MKFTSLEREIPNIFIACRRSDVTPTVATTNATVDVALK
jgi:hypothetical protein